MDRLTPSRRSWLMSRVRSKDTTPELAVRRLLHSLGYRFRLHRRDLPGVPDIVLPAIRTVIFVHGCFWHRHPKCRKASNPSTRVEFWKEKFNRNVLRDKECRALLRRANWSVLVVWECQTKEKERLCAKLEEFLGSRMVERIRQGIGGGRKRRSRR